jgi:hypothetical protein
MWRKYPDDEEPASNIKQPSTWFHEYKKTGEAAPQKPLNIN